MQLLNGYRPVTIPSISAEPSPVMADLDIWDTCIGDLDAALAAAAAAHADADAASVDMERLEAAAVLTVEGGNAETRKARLTLQLADDTRYQEARSRHCEARQRLADCERVASVSRERMRLLAAAVSLQRD